MSGRAWKPAELAIIRHEYPHTENRFLAWRLKRSVKTIYLTAARLGVKKTTAFLSAAGAARMQARGMGVGHRFAPGHRPWNAGVKGYRCSPRTEFKKGHRPHTWLPIGSERRNREGHLQRKMTDTGCSRRDWRSVHVMVWEAAHGPAPPSHVVAFKERGGAPVLKNLECISRAELARRNSVWTNYPPELARLVQLRGALNRQINRRGHAEQN